MWDSMIFSFKTDSLSNVTTNGTGQTSGRVALGSLWDREKEGGGGGRGGGVGWLKLGRGLSLVTWNNEALCPNTPGLKPKGF